MKAAMVLRGAAADNRPRCVREGFDTRTGFGLLDIPAALAAPAPRVTLASRTTTSIW
jgi:hypothetical protein